MVWYDGEVDGGGDGGRERSMKQDQIFIDEVANF